MKTADYESLILRLEEKSRKNPQAYRNRLLLLAGLGYGYIGLILLFLTGLVAGLVLLMVYARGGGALIVKLGILIGAFIWFILRVLFLRLQAPGGRLLVRSEAPLLFSEVESMCKRLRAPVVDEIKVDDEMNASISRVPRFGLLGWPRHYLVLGLPLMAALSPEEMKSVIAHEMGHHSKLHGRFSAWVYRVRLTWFNLVGGLEASGHWGGALFKPFFNWYAPYFGAWSFVLARQQEYEADSVAAELTSPAVAARALQRLNVVAPAIQQTFWKPVLRRATEEKTPPDRVFSELEEHLRAGVPEATARNYLTKALRERTGFSDTHPSLQDRLKALGEAPVVPGPLKESAGSHYLGSTFPKLSEEFGKQWSQYMASYWEDIAEEQRKLRESYQTLRIKAGTEKLGKDEALKLAQAVEDYEGAEAARPYYRELVLAHPDHLDAAFSLGRIELEAGSESGVELLRKVYQQDARYGVEASARIIDFYRSSREEEKARAYMDEYDRFCVMQSEAKQERAVLKPKDALEHHGLDDGAWDRLAAQLLKRTDVVQAWLVRKKVRHYPEMPLYILALKPAGAWWKWRSDSEDVTLVQRLVRELVFPGETFVITAAAGGQGGLFKRITQMSGARIL